MEIFREKGGGINASDICEGYYVNEKTVLDIWRGRTWVKETSHLSLSRVFPFKKLGRPVGSKDVKPRKHRVSAIDGGNKTSSTSSPFGQNWGFNLDEDTPGHQNRLCWVQYNVCYTFLVTKISTSSNSWPKSTSDN